MRVGLFGDSYCDIVYFNDEKYQENPDNWGRQYKTWPGRLLDDLKAPILSSGLGGSCLYDSICKWESDIHKDSYDVVLWSFTWHDRLYTSEHFQPVFLARAERRPMPESTNPDVNYHEIDKGIDLYYKYFYYDNQQKFYYEQSLKWILELPTQYKNTKFIFLPCTEYARTAAKKYFSEGLLVNFSFETLSNLETNSPGPMPIMCNRLGHLNNHDHECMTEMVKNLIINYNEYENKIVNPNFTNFDLMTIPNFS